MGTEKERQDAIEHKNKQRDNQSKFNGVLVAAQQVIAALENLNEAYQKNGNQYLCHSIIGQIKVIEEQRTSVCEAEKEGY